MGAQKARKVVVFGVDKLPIGVEFQFANGNSHRVLGEDFTQEMVAYLLANGISQKFGDLYSKSDNADHAEALFLAGLEQVKDGIWAARGGPGGQGLLAEAIARVTGKAVEAVREKLATMGEADRKKLEKRPDVKAAILAIKAERAEKAADGAGDDDLLDAFMDD